ncbi:MAG: hypothetical protein ACI4Q5_00195 [Porcipelethomonas sp.]
MKFSEFAQILYKFHGDNKYEFTKELLQAGLNSGCTYIANLKDDKTCKDRVRKLFRTSQGISVFAREIINFFDKAIFIDYIYEILNKEDYSEVCKCFSEYSIIIEEENITGDLADIFYNILKEATRGKVRAVPKTCTVSEADKNDIREIAKNLCSIIYKYKNDSLEYHIKSSSLYTITEEEKSQFNYKIDNNFENFNSLNFRLEMYNNIYPDFEVLSDIVQHYYGIVKSDFEYKYSQELNTLIISPNIEEYNDLLLKIITELSNS